MVILFLKKITKDGAPPSFALVVEYRGDTGHWLFIRRGESIVFLADGKRIGLILAGDVVRETERRSLGGLLLKERAAFVLGEATLKQLSQATDLRFKLSGQSSYLERLVSKPGIDYFRRFVMEAVGP